jgi:hypothetical protein
MASRIELLISEFCFPYCFHFHSDSESMTTTSSGTSTPDYTSDQLVQVRRIIAKKCYYEILEVNRNASDDEIKKAYRKLALRFHPDKCRAPQAEEAFKKISKAFQCLSDGGKRRTYDVSGSDEPENRQFYANGHVNPGDIFEHLFRQQNFHGNQYYDGQQQAGMGVFPLLFFFGFMFLSSIFSTFSGSGTNRPRFSFTPSTGLAHPQSTEYIHVDYWSASPTVYYKQRFDRHVETVYLQTLMSECQYEDRVFSYRKRRGEPTDGIRLNCEKLEKIQKQFPKIFNNRINYSPFEF